MMHSHSKSEQFFYVLDGIATFVVDGESVELKPREGIHIKPGIPHRLHNAHSETLLFIVISTPPSHGDRVDL